MEVFFGGNGNGNGIPSCKQVLQEGIPLWEVDNTVKLCAAS